jgi:hypothetical protein
MDTPFLNEGSTFWTAVGALGSLGTTLAAFAALLFARGQIRGIRVQSEVSAKAATSQLHSQVSRQCPK